jgi:hypothetical protein
MRCLGVEAKRVNEEQTESAKIVLLKAFRRIELPVGVGKRGFLSLHPASKHLAISASAFSAISAVKFFYSFSIVTRRTPRISW